MKYTTENDPDLGTVVRWDGGDYSAYVRRSRGDRGYDVVESGTFVPAGEVIAASGDSFGWVEVALSELKPGTSTHPDPTGEAFRREAMAAAELLQKES